MAGAFQGRGVPAPGRSRGGAWRAATTWTRSVATWGNAWTNRVSREAGDTSVAIDHLRGAQPAVELLAGVREKKIDALEQSFSAFGNRQARADVRPTMKINEPPSRPRLWQMIRSGPARGGAHRTAAAALFFVVLLAGCTAGSYGRPARRHFPGVGGQAPNAVAAADRHAAAAADAASLLALAPVPPGAQPASSSPVAETSGAPQTPGTPDLVDQSTWWTAPGSTALVTAWVQAHVPPGAAMVGSGSTSTRGTVTSRYVVFAFAARQPVLTERALTAMVAPDGPAQVALRADAQVVWDPARSAASLVEPAMVGSITVTRRPGFPMLAGPGTTVGLPAHDTTVTTTNPALVHHIVTVLDGLPVDNSGVHSCPAWSGLAFTMNLVARDKTTLATVSGNQAQCGGLALTVGGKPQPSVDDPGDVLLGQVASMLGTHLPAG